MLPRNIKLHKVFSQMFENLLESTDRARLWVVFCLQRCHSRVMWLSLCNGSLQLPVYHGAVTTNIQLTRCPNKIN